MNLRPSGLCEPGRLLGAQQDAGLYSRTLYQAELRRDTSLISLFLIVV